MAHALQDNATLAERYLSRLTHNSYGKHLFLVSHFPCSCMCCSAICYFVSGYLCEVSILENCLKSNIGDCTFQVSPIFACALSFSGSGLTHFSVLLVQEAFNLTGRVLNITVNSTQEFEGPRLLNYLTFPNVVCLQNNVVSP